MHVERYGSGSDAFFCLHGWGGDHSTYAPLAARLPPEASVHAADLPGYGRSPRPAEWSADAIGREIADAICSLSAPRVTLVGNCSGAVFGLVAAGLVPGRIARIVMIDAFAFLPWYFKVFVHPVYGEVAYRSTFANPVGRWLTNASLRQRRTADTHLTGSFKGVDHHVSVQYLRMLDAIDGIGRFAGITRPIDLIYGGRTFSAVKASVIQWQGLWPHARAHRLDEAGHLPIEEATEAVASIVFRGSLAEARR